MTCLLSGVFVTSMFIQNIATVVTVCEFHCPDDQGGRYPIAAVIPYGAQCLKEIQVDENRRIVPSSALAPLELEEAKDGN